MATVAGLWQTLFKLAPRLSGSDRDLLARYAATGDGPAFTELVRRHGGLVWAVCRRHLREPADAEDAFQATFLVLAAKPHAVRRAESLGAWLHGTAWRVAARVRRRRGRTHPPVDPPARPDDPSLRDALAALDEELVRLPAKYRQPLTACYLLDRTQDEAAADLGLSVSTVKRRLAAGRELLRQRLNRRGVELGAVLAALALRAPDAPALLVQSTLTAATLGVASATVSPLVQGVFVMMWQAKLKAWAVGLGLATATLGGTGYLATSGHGQGPPAPGTGPAMVEKPAVKASEKPTVLPPAKVEKPAVKASEKPTVPPPAKGEIFNAVEELQFDIDRAKLQIQRADRTIDVESVSPQLRGNLDKSERTPISSVAYQAKEDKLVAERALKIAERRLAAVKGQPVAAAEPMSAELHKLREKRLTALRQTWKLYAIDTVPLFNAPPRKEAPEHLIRQDAFEIGSMFFPPLMKLCKSIVEAELAVATTVNQQVAAWRDHTEQLKFIRQNLAAKVVDAPWWIAELIDAELVAEIKLLELGAK
jgi:RNA polymerase sigma factor (sigma-70 family)